MIFIKSTSESYSITQNWKEYHNIDNWNLGVGLPPQYNVDIDEDGVADSIRDSGCAFLSSVKTESIPKAKKCTRQDFVTGKERIGQYLSLPTDNGGDNGRDPLYLSFIVKTHENKWKYYDYIGIRVSVSEKGQDNIFQEIKPTYLDYVDLIYYQISHIFFRLFGFFFPIILVIAFFIFIVFLSRHNTANKDIKEGSRLDN